MFWNLVTFKNYLNSGFVHTKAQIFVAFFLENINFLKVFLFIQVTNSNEIRLRILATFKKYLISGFVRTKARQMVFKFFKF